MSRLERHRQKKIKIYIAVLIGGVLFFIFFGLPLFISGSVYLSNLFGGNSDEDSDQSQTFRDVQIYDIPQVTNQPEVTVSGTVSNFDNLEFHLNGDKVEEIEVSEKTEFSETISGLNEGDNELYIIGKVNSSSENKKTPVYKIIFKKEKPKLEISEPADGFRTVRSEVKVAGSTDPDVEILVNGIPVVVDPNGNFQTQVRLNNGDNKIVVTAEDIAGNKEEKTLNVNSSPDN